MYIKLFSVCADILLANACPSERSFSSDCDMSYNEAAVESPASFYYQPPHQFRLYTCMLYMFYIYTCMCIIYIIIISNNI